MSRRLANPAADRAAQNQQTIKSLLKIEENKSCADCKRNKHPRWASWNLGVFVCIRCSGIHRGMGTHISRVKSVDLDSWTDEQLQSVLRWGNARANKYWEEKLAPGHVPSEAKIENFIRTKYESKRWVMDGPMPDPSTLDTEGDDDVPLNIVQEKAKLDRSSSRRNGSTPSQAPAPAKKPQQQTFDLMGDEIITPPVRPSTTDNPSVRPPPPKPAPATASQLLGGLDFLGGTPERPASASSKLANSTGPSRPDLKQSILSLYATAPRSQSQPQPQPSQQNSRQSSMGGTQSSAVPSSTAFGGLDDAFRGLDFSTSTSPPASQPVQQPQQPPKLSSFGSFGQISSQRTAPATPQLTSTPLSGGGFFDTGPKPPPKQTSSVRNAPPQSLRKISNASSGFGEFNSALNPTTASSIATSTNGLLDLSSPQSIASSKPANPSTNVSSVFNLSASKPASQYQTVTQSSAPPTQNTFSNLSNADAWGSNDAWSTPEPAAPASQVKSIKSPAMPPATQSDFGWGDVPSSNAPMPSLAKSPNMSSATTSDFGWANATSTNAGGFGMPSPPSNGFSTQAPNPSQKFDMSAPPTITADEDFGGWNSAAPETPVVSGVPPPLQTSPQPTKPANGFNASEDLWSNVWQ